MSEKKFWKGNNGLVSGASISLGLLFLLVSCSSSRQETKGEHILWKAKGDNNTVYLLGSVHLLPESAHPFPPAFNEAYNDAEHLVFEISLDTNAMMESMVGVFMKAMLPDGKTLPDVLSKETWDKLEPKLDESLSVLGEQMGGGLPMLGDASMMKNLMMRFEPWFVAFMIQTSDIGAGDFRPELGVDMFYTTKAQEDGKSIEGLETIAEQFGFLESLSGDAGEEFLLSVLSQSGGDSDELNRLVAAWKNGDVNELDKLVNGSMKDTPEVYDKLLVERNENWIPKIERYLRAQENYLVVVGAGHLVGDKSVIALLRERGYTLERI